MNENTAIEKENFEKLLLNMPFLKVIKQATITGR